MKDDFSEKQKYSGELSKPPVFVVGYMHSGTTLLVNILRSHSTVFSGNRETKYFMHLPMIRETYPNLDDDKILRDFVFYVIAVVKTGFNRNKLDAKTATDFRLEWFGHDEKRLDALMEDAKKNRNYGKMFNLVSNHMAQSMGKSRWVEKTPTHIFHINDVVKNVPDVRFVEIVRDPRDVLASKKTRRADVWKSEKYADNRLKKHLEKAFDPFWDSLSWKSAVSAGRLAREKYPDRTFLVNYEDLVANPEQKVREVCNFLDMEFEPEMLNITARNSAENHVEEDQAGIVTTSIGRWKKSLTPAETGVCQLQVGKDMKDLGYSLAPIPFFHKLKIPFLLAKSAFEFVQRSYRRWRSGGWSYFQNIFTNYWKRVRFLLFPS